MAVMDIHQVLRHLPHRYPFLLIDRVLECEPGKSLLALKNITYSEPFFQGHFPDYPVMPAVLVLEAMAQATALLGLSSPELEPTERSIYYFVGIDKARFRKPVGPGDQLLIEVHLRRNCRGVCLTHCAARANDAVVATAEIMGALREAEA